MDGKRPSESRPDSVYASVWHTPVARNLDEHLALARTRELDLLDLQRLAGLDGDGGAHLHRGFLRARRLAPLAAREEMQHASGRRRSAGSEAATRAFSSRASCCASSRYAARPASVSASRFARALLGSGRARREALGLERVGEPLHALAAHPALARQLAQVARAAQRQAAQQRHAPVRDGQLREQRQRSLELPEQMEERHAGFRVRDARGIAARGRVPGGRGVPCVCIGPQASRERS